VVKNVGLPLEFDDICHTFGDICTSGFGGHFWLLSVFEITVFEITVVDSVRFAIDKKQI